MIEVTQSTIELNGLTAVFWYSPDCPVCEQFLNVEIPKVEKVMSNWTFMKINFLDHAKEHIIMFEPSRMPKGYFFNNNKRLFVGDGFVPASEVINLMKTLESPDFKTEEELIEEQFEQI
jgi:hypothetical protein